MRGWIMPAAGLALAALIAGCGEAQTSEDADAATVEAVGAAVDAADGEAAAGDVELRLSSEGLATGSVGLHSNDMIAFGAPRADAVASVSAIRGPQTGSGSNDECGAGPMEFAEFGALTLNFQEDRFVGWSLAGPPASETLSDEWGLALGTPRANLTDADQPPARIEPSTLGEEFDANGIGGLLTGAAPDATVEALWAGVNCHFR